MPPLKNDKSKIRWSICIIASIVAVAAFTITCRNTGFIRLDLASFLVSSLLAAGALIIAGIEYSGYRQEKRIEEFKMLNQGLSKFRFNYAEKLRKEYEKTD